MSFNVNKRWWFRIRLAIFGFIISAGLLKLNVLNTPDYFEQLRQTGQSFWPDRVLFSELLGVGLFFLLGWVLDFVTGFSGVISRPPRHWLWYGRWIVVGVLGGATFRLLLTMPNNPSFLLLSIKSLGSAGAFAGLGVMVSLFLAHVLDWK